MTFTGLDAACLRLARLILGPRSRGPLSCARCGPGLSREDFPADRGRPSGHYPLCKDCVSEKGRAYYAALGPAKKAAKRRAKDGSSRAGKRESERIRQTVRGAIARGALRLLAEGRTVDGRRGWTRPDRRRAGT